MPIFSIYITKFIIFYFSSSFDYISAGNWAAHVHILRPVWLISTNSGLLIFGKGFITRILMIIIENLSSDNIDPFVVVFELWLHFIFDLSLSTRLHELFHGVTFVFCFRLTELIIGSTWFKSILRWFCFFEVLWMWGETVTLQRFVIGLLCSKYNLRFIILNQRSRRLRTIILTNERE